MPDVGKHQGLVAGQDGTPSIPDHTLLCPIGEGSYGDVWLAKNAVGTLRAVKIIHRSRFRDEGPYEREFTGLKHFEPISRSHEGFVDILQVGRDDLAGVFYYIMEAADPQPPPPDLPSANSDLTYRPATLESLTRSQGRVPAAESIRIAGVLAGALHHLHGLGLVHRDIKPSNIIFVGGVPKLADVGLVTRADSARTFVGTEGFLPPEGPGTVQADIFSLGKCLYEMAMGKDRQAFPSPPTLLGEMPDRALLLELNEIINRACAPNPKKRYRTAEALRADLAVLEKGGSIRALRKRRLQISLLCGGLMIASLAVWNALHPPARRLEVASETTPPAGFKALAIVGRYKAGDEPSLYFAELGQLYVQSLHGLRQQVNAWPGAAGDVFKLSLLADVDGDGFDNPIVATRNGSNIALRVFNEKLYETRTINDVGGFAEREDPAKDPVACSEMRAWHFFPARGTIEPRLLTETFHGYARLERHLRMISTRDPERVLWSYPMASSSCHLLVADINGDGVEEIIIGTSASSNGAKTPDGRTDYKSDLIVLDQQGKELVRQIVGGPLTDVEPIVGSQGGNSMIWVRCTRTIPNSLCSMLQTNGPDAKRPPEGHILRFSTAGELQAEWSTTNEMSTFRLATLRKGGPQVILATDGAGILRMFDAMSLAAPIAEVRVASRNGDFVHQEITGVTDLDGDGRMEVVLVACQVIAKLKRGMGKPDDATSDDERIDAELIVLNDKLKIVARAPIAQSEGFPGHQIVQAESGTDRLLMLSGTKFTFYRLR